MDWKECFDSGMVKEVKPDKEMINARRISRRNSYHVFLFNVQIYPYNVSVIDTKSIYNVSVIIRYGNAVNDINLIRAKSI